MDLSGLNAVLDRIDQITGQLQALGGSAVQETRQAGKGFADALAAAADRAGLPTGLVDAVVQAESGGNPNAVSKVGAEGLMQLMPGTAKALGVSDPFDPAQNLEGGTRYLKSLVDRFHDLPEALAAYNAGPNAVKAAGGIPPYPETRAYVRRVLDLYKANGPIGPTPQEDMP